MRLLTKTEVKMGGCWPFFESYRCASFKSAQTPALCNQCVESLTRIFFSKSIFAAWLSSCFNEGTRNWHMFATTRVVSISLTITRVTNIVRFTEVSLYRGSLHEGSSVLSQSSSSSQNNLSTVDNFMWPTYSDNVSHKVSISIYILTAKILKKHTSSVTTEESGNKTVATKPRTTCATCCHNLQHQNLLRDKLRAKVVIPATTLYNFQCNNVALQVERKCCPYYLTVTCFATLLQNDLNSDVASLFQALR